MSLNCEQIFDNLWQQYIGLNPAAQKIHQLLKIKSNPKVLNDHVAFRTFSHPRLGIEQLANTFKKLGYVEKGDYHFEVKKLYAKHYEHKDKSLPKVFISELLLNQFSQKLQGVFNQVAENIKDSTLESDSFSYSGSHWPKKYSIYMDLYKESPYGAWLYAFGFCANHFTVFFNSLEQFKNLEELNQFLKENQFTLNASGGEIKGSPAEFLEQSSTMAAEVELLFEDGKYKVPSCYYEFARRYPDKNNQLYQGFVASSADKIFESTNKS